MTRFDSGNRSQIEHEIYKNVSYPIRGTVKRVYEHLESADTSNFEVDVAVEGGTKLIQRIPIETPGSSTIDIPKVEDNVIVSYRGTEGGKPFVSSIMQTDADRPPVGRAGMYRKEFESANSPAGDGNLYLTGTTTYDETPADNDKNTLTPEQARVRIAKRTDDVPEPSAEDNVPAKVEFLDNPKDDESYITVEINKDNGADADATWGMRFNIKTGEFKLVDPEGFGIEASGDGDFTWHHKSIDFNEVSGSTGPLSLD